MPMRRRAGLSRAEVLVVVLLVLVLVGLILVGIGKMRGAADLQKCRSNQKTLGLAVHNYASTYNDKLPPLTDQGKRAPTGHGLPSMFALLTPYIESDPWNYHDRRTETEYHAHSSISFTFQGRPDVPVTEHGGIANQSRWPFPDPADETADKLRDVPMTLPDGSTGYYATGSYAANGLAPWGVRGIEKAFPNGTENAILIGERPQVCRTAAGDDVYNLWGLGFYSPHMPAFAALTPSDPPGLLSTGQVAAVPPLPDENAADRDSLIRVRVGRRDAAPGPADFPTPVQRVRSGRACDPRLPGGPHLAGMQVLMADVSVRVFGWDTDPWVFWAACLPGGATQGSEGP
jgi:hypothetical protein